MGRPVRPGQSPDGSLLLPLEKARGGDDAPAFAVEIFYLAKATPWNEKGKETVTLPSLDLPISRTGVLLYYPPMFRVTAEPGSFRTQEYQNPMSAALATATPEETIAVNAPASASPTRLLADKQRAEGERKDTQSLLDNFKAKSLGGRVTGVLPVNVSFPAFGPSIYLVSELTSENQSPAAELNFQRDKKGGVQ